MPFQPRSEAGASERFGILATVRIRRWSWGDGGEDETFVAGTSIVHEGAGLVTLMVNEWMNTRSTRVMLSILEKTVGLRRERVWKQATMYYCWTNNAIL